MDHDILAFYAAPGAMTEPGRHAAAIEAVWPGLDTVAAAVQGELIHEHMADRYGQTLSPERKAQSHLRSVEQMLDQVPLGKPLPPDQRLVGVCRHYSVLGAAILRAHGVPARARCGFADYFVAGKFIDHWIVEAWSGERWMRADFQLDPVQRDMFRIDFDPLDQPQGRFLTGGEAWRRCRAGQADPADFCMLDMCGLWFVAGNLVRDLAALNKVELLPWDVWGAMVQSDAEITGEHRALFDQIADLTCEIDPRFDEARAIYQADARLRAPDKVFNALRQALEPVA